MARDTMAATLAVRSPPLPLARRPGLAAGRAQHLVYRRHLWLLIVSGFFEPLFYLLSIGVGIGALVGTVAGPDGQPIELHSVRRAGHARRRRR